MSCWRLLTPTFALLDGHIYLITAGLCRGSAAAISRQTTILATLRGACVLQRLPLHGLSTRPKPCLHCPTRLSVYSGFVLAGSLPALISRLDIAAAQHNSEFSKNCKFLKINVSNHGKGGRGSALADAILKCQWISNLTWECHTD